MIVSDSFDIAVIGGGLAGTAAAVAAARSGYATVHFAPAGPVDRRTSALMTPSVAVLEYYGLAGADEALGVPLRRIRIIDATGRLIRAPETLFDAADAGLEQFGWNFANAALLDSMTTAGKTLPNLTIIEQAVEAFDRTGAIFSLTDAAGAIHTAKLLVGADGRKSRVRAFAGIGTREHQLGQSALVADLTLDRPLDGESVEFHYPDGPFTLVPAGDNRANLVWIDTPHVLETVRDGTDAGIEAYLRAKSQNLFGNVRLASRTFVFPLATLDVTEAGRDGIFLVGEAAHAFPPIGAQGLNLGLRDLAGLMAILEEMPLTENGADAVSAAYAAKRTADLRATGTMVGTLFGSLVEDFLPAQAVRAGGLWALKTLPALRRQAFRAGMGGARG